MSSPFFEDLLSLPQPTDVKLIDGLCVVQFSYEMVFALLAACQKYDMPSIQQDIRDEVNLGRFPTPDEAQAFIAYTNASSLGLIPEMEHAARLTLGQPMTFESLGEGLRLFKAQALCELVRYRANSR